MMKNNKPFPLNPYPPGHKPVKPPEYYDEEEEYD
jgi:hypothetical protein